MILFYYCRGIGAYGFFDADVLLAVSHDAPRRYRTMMSGWNWDCSGPRINYFSNPEVTVRGNPTGISDTYDNARTIRDNMVRCLNKSTTF